MPAKTTPAKTNLWASLMTACALLVGAASAQAQVYVDDIEISGDILRMKSQTWGLFGTRVDTLGAGVAEFTTLGIAELYKFFDADAGTLIDEGFVNGTPPILGNDGLDPTSFVVALEPGERRYVAYWDARPYNGGQPPEAFGWLELAYAPEGVAVTSSATSAGLGIRVGSVTAVPEPNAMYMWGMAALGLAAVRRGLKPSQAVPPTVRPSMRRVG